MQLILEYGQFVFAITWTELFAHGRITYGYRERLIHEARRVVSETNATIWQRAQAHTKTFRRILYIKQKLTNGENKYTTLAINKQVTLNGVTYLPSDVTSPVLLSKFSRGILTWLNVAKPLSMPFWPTFGPMSPAITPGNKSIVFVSLCEKWISF